MVSIVIICKNEAHIIGQTLESLKGITDDIVIVDSGSTDETLPICLNYGARICSTTWDGYGKNKNKGIALAKYDWILSLDADESVDTLFKTEVKQLDFSNENRVYAFDFKNFFCGKEIRFGVWGTDQHPRIFNRKQVRWNEAEVHEALLMHDQIKLTTGKGHILHYTVHTLNEYTEKTIHYAKMSALKYHQKGKKAHWIKLYLSPFFTFLYHYIFRLGFLDGWEGFLICKTNAWYSFLKYAFLRERIKNSS